MIARKGFTLLEILVSIGIGLLILGSVATATTAFTKHRQLDATADMAVSYLRTAAMRAAQSEDNLPHGVKMANGQITLFRGTSYDLRETDGDTVWVQPSYITVTGPTEIVFSKEAAVPSATGNIVFFNGRNTVTITVYATGAVSQL